MQETAVRICFVLGNLSADHDPTRELLYFTHGAIPLLNDLCTQYFGAEKAVRLVAFIGNHD